MNTFFNKALATCLFASAFVACKEEAEEIEQSVFGVSQSHVQVSNVGASEEITFVTFANWSVSGGSEWCKIDTTTLNGGIGDGKVKLTISPNPDDVEARHTTISINVEGYPEQVLCKVSQGAEYETPDPDGLDVNRWISQHMSDNYLWNQNYVEIKDKLSFSITEPTAFLQKALERMTDNEEDGGVYSDGERHYYSSIMEVPMTESRALTKLTGYGITKLYSVGVENGYYFLVGGVYPESPAAIKGIKRGMYITSYNGAPITSYNLEEAFYVMMSYAAPLPTLSVDLKQYVKVGSDFQGDKYQLQSVGNKVISPIEYSKNPVMFTGIYGSPNSDKKVGYLVYNDFDAAADEELLGAFERLKANGANELILDLRYNGGGDVISSALMATAIVGEAHKGGVYSEMEFNALRRAKGEVEKFYIGQDPSMHEYPLMQRALATSLNLNRVYVIATEYTASASELIINGLRGLGVDVYVVGGKTEGKNVGMEVVASMWPEYKDYNFDGKGYYLSAITFYNRNAVGFKDFPNGFPADFTAAETDNILFDWDCPTEQDLCKYASIMHIMTDRWPTITRTSELDFEPLKVDFTTNLKEKEGNAIVMPAEYYTR